ncbi:MAG: hypothetical protein IJ600_11620 [Lachnospiraceae bacterium]|nr:hypothetical protein [Lachnospiraceae bacterium]
MSFLNAATQRKNENGAPVASAPVQKSVDEIAKEVIAGKWGVGQDRTRKLTDAGYDASAVQKRVNELMKK